MKITSFRNVTEKSLKFMSKPQPFHSFKLFADEEDFAEIVYEKDVKILTYFVAVACAAMLQILLRLETLARLQKLHHHLHQTQSF